MRNFACGQINNLSRAEKDEYELLLEHRFVIRDQIGISGARTTAFLMQDIEGQHFVLKIANKSEDVHWIEDQKRSYENASAALCKYSGNMYIPKLLTAGDDYIVEEFAGEEFTRGFYYTCLDENERRQSAIDLASLLVCLHENSMLSEPMPLDLLKDPPLHAIFDFMIGSMDQSKSSRFLDLINEFEKRDVHDEVSVLTHGDIRSQNILFNKNYNRLALIDFELLKTRNIYHDFVPFAAASYGCAYNFLWDTIDAYNSISSRFRIDKGKVMMFHYLGILHEYGRCAMMRSCSIEDLKRRCDMAANLVFQLENERSF